VDGTQINKCWDVSKNVRHFPKSEGEETIEYFYYLMFAVCTEAKWHSLSVSDTQTQSHISLGKYV
jgi:hypothetical protein